MIKLGFPNKSAEEQHGKRDGGPERNVVVSLEGRTQVIGFATLGRQHDARRPPKKDAESLGIYEPIWTLGGPRNQ